MYGLAVVMSGLNIDEMGDRDKLEFITISKGQLISKAIFVFLTYSKKRTKII